MSVTIISLNDHKVPPDSLDKLRNKKHKHPWDLADLSQYLHYCCPECEFKSRQDFLLRHHMKQNHEEVNAKRRKLSAEALIEKFLKEDFLTETNSNELHLSDRVDVIKNPILKLPVKIYHHQQVSESYLPEKLKSKDQSFSVSILPSKVQNCDQYEYSTEFQNQNYKDDDVDQFLADNSFFNELEDNFGDDNNFLEEVKVTDIKEDKSQNQTTSTKAIAAPKAPGLSPPSSSMLGKASKKCQDCSIVFLTSFRLQRHIKKFHGGVTPTMANSDTPIGDDSNVAEMPRPYSCQLCQKSFTSHAYLASHIRKAHEKRFRCEECGKCYGGSSYLREHIEAVHRKTKNFICQFCSASFYSKTQLTNHCMRNHSEGEEKPCPECNKIFTNDLSLKLHMRNVHQPVKSICSTCGKEYPNEVSLKKHIQCVHEKKKPYQCHICSKMFGSKWYVQQHITKMHEDIQRVPSFKCSDCDYEFATMRDRNAHVLKIHGKKFVGKPRVKNRFPGMEGTQTDELSVIMAQHDMI